MSVNQSINQSINIYSGQIVGNNLIPVPYGALNELVMVAINKYNTRDIVFPATQLCAALKQGRFFFI